MSIELIRPKTWEVRVYIDSFAGKERYAYSTVEGKKADALEMERKLAMKKGSHARLSAFSLDLSQYLDFWLSKYVLPFKTSNTCAFYKMNINRRTIPYLGAIKLRMLSPQVIQSFYNRTLSIRIDGRRGNLSSSSLRGIHRTLHAALGRAVKLDLIERNPADRVELPAPSKYRPRVLLPEEAHKLLEVAKDSRDFALIATVLFTGLRLGELLSLLWEGINFSNGTIKVDKSKTDSGIRVVTIPSVAVSILKRQRDSIQGNTFSGILGGKEVKRTHLSSKICQNYAKQQGFLKSVSTTCATHMQPG